MSILKNWTASYVITDHLVAALWGWIDSHSGDFSMMIKYRRYEIRHQNSLNAMRPLEYVTGTLPYTEARWIKKG